MNQQGPRGVSGAESRSSEEEVKKVGRFAVSPQLMGEGNVRRSSRLSKETPSSRPRTSTLILDV